MPDADDRETLRDMLADDDRVYNADEVEFMLAMDRYKRENRKPFPTWSDVLSVLIGLGYRKPGAPTV